MYFLYSNYYRILKLSLVILYCINFIRNIDYTLASVLAISIHELAHIIFLKSCDISVTNFKVSLLGFRINLSEKKHIDKELIIYFVGSLFNILVGIVCLVIKNIFKMQFLDKFIIANFMIGFVNLIPVFPLDGAIIFKNILFRKFRQNTAILISIFTSLISAVVILIFIIVLVLKFSFINITHIVIVIFMIVSTYREYKLLMSTFMISKIDYEKYLFLKKKYIKTVVISVIFEVELLELIKLYKFNRFLIFYFLDNELKVIGIMNEFNVLECYKKFGNVTVRECYKSLNQMDW